MDFDAIDFEEDDHDYRRMAMDDRCWDGSWLASGLHGMLVDLSQPDFCEEELQEYPSCGEVVMEDDFLTLPEFDDYGRVHEEWSRMHQEILEPRQLHVADGLTRMFLEQSCPPKIRIRRLKDEEMKDLLQNKQLGNACFAQQDYEKAIEHYQDALFVALDPLFVAPKAQVQEIVNVLSNQAECYLRLEQYQEAGDAATCALLFDGLHQKSRLRRAKAEIALKNIPMLVQAQVDLQEIVHEASSSPLAVKEANKHLLQVQELLNEEEEMFSKDKDWNLYIRSLRSHCR